jgi:hypothetical protein
MQASHTAASERAWVTVEIIPGDPTDMQVWEKADKYVLGIPVRLKNIGKTPARITNSYIRHVFADTVNTKVLPHVPRLPETPDYEATDGTKIVPEDKVMMPQKTYDFLISLPKIAIAHELPKWKIADTLLCVYGLVRYDSLGEVRETRFCYTYFFTRPMGYLVNKETGEQLFPPAYEEIAPKAYKRIT